MISLLEIVKSIDEVDDEKIIKYKKKDGESGEMKAGSAKSMPKKHPAKLAWDKMQDDGGDDSKKDSGDKLGGGDFDRDGDDDADDMDRDARFAADDEESESELDALDKKIKSTEARMNMAASNWSDPREQDVAYELRQDLEKLQADREKLAGGNMGRTGNELNQETLMIDGKQYRRISEKTSKPKYKFSELYKRFKK